MKLSNYEKGAFGALLMYILVIIYFVVCWVVNLIQFIGCDFEPSYKDEIVKAAGIFIAPLSGITVWF